jgi:ATP-dependent helicase/nuclease subunit A
MTIHRAKGLEFDCVILLGLNRAPPPNQGRGLYWLERVTDDGADDLLLAPLTPTGDNSDPLATLIRHTDTERDLAERARLFYVATTRARERLHLIAQAKPEAAAATRRSLLCYLWPQFEDSIPVTEPSEGEADARPASLQPILRRLSDGFDVVPRKPDTDIDSDTEPDPEMPLLRPDFDWAGQAALQIGTVVHDGLQLIAETGLETWSVERVQSRTGQLRGDLRLLGVDKDDLNDATKRVVNALSRVLGDANGRWLLSNHPESASELPLTVETGAGLEHLRLDRTFIDEKGTRWIVDFKTSAHEGGAADAFLQSEVERYRPQLERYARAMSEIDDRPIRVGLYFPLLQAFRDWEPELDAGNASAH